MSSNLPDLVTMFDALAPAGSQDDVSCFAAQRLSGYPAHYVGKDATGRPAMLVGVASGPGEAHPAPIVLEHLTVLHNVNCRLQEADGTMRSSCFTMVRCLGPSRELHEHFLRTMAPVVMALGQAPSHEEVIRSVRTLIELFRAMAKPPRKPIQGLWAELFVIACSADPPRLIRAWHSTPEDRYDFCEGQLRVEVKSATGHLRAHQFSLDQVCVPTGVRVLIGSLFVERSAGGDNVYDLIHIIQERVADHLLLAQLDQTVANTLGEDWRRAADLRFDREIATESLRFFDAVDVPSVGPDAPIAVSEIRFKSDLAGIREAEPAAFAAQGGLFRAALSRRSPRAATR